MTVIDFPARSASLHRRQDQQARPPRRSILNNLSQPALPSLHQHRVVSVSVEGRERQHVRQHGHFPPVIRTDFELFSLVCAGKATRPVHGRVALFFWSCLRLAAVPALELTPSRRRPQGRPHCDGPPAMARDGRSSTTSRRPRPRSGVRQRRPRRERSERLLSDTTSTWEWNLADEAEDADFEIDADATSLLHAAGNSVTFKAKALNGTPPFTFEWEFRRRHAARDRRDGEAHLHRSSATATSCVTGQGRERRDGDHELGILVATCRRLRRPHAARSEKRCRRPPGPSSLPPAGHAVDGERRRACASRTRAVRPPASRAGRS